MIRLAAEFGSKVNTGRVRGLIHEGETVETATGRFLECLNAVADVAEPLGVELIVEPVNRYEVNFINTCGEAIELIERCGRRCVKLMPDVFHMNIEDTSFRESFEAGARYISYVHFADSNRLAPGWGHLDFDGILSILEGIGYDGWITAEILPKPDPDAAAAQAAHFLLPRIARYSRRLAIAE
jgi:sugar phosphate isomerase/epimerase